MSDLFSYWFTLLLRAETGELGCGNGLSSSTRGTGWPGRVQGAPLEAKDAALAEESARLSRLLDLYTEAAGRQWRSAAVA